VGEDEERKRSSPELAPQTSVDPALMRHVAVEAVLGHTLTVFHAPMAGDHCTVMRPSVSWTHADRGSRDMVVAPMVRVGGAAIVDACASYQASQRSSVHVVAPGVQHVTLVTLPGGVTW
jgi:hypothetical protein